MPRMGPMLLMVSPPQRTKPTRREKTDTHQRKRLSWLIFAAGSEREARTCLQPSEKFIRGFTQKSLDLMEEFDHAEGLGEIGVGPLADSEVDVVRFFPSG